MGAGPSKRQLSDGIRRALYRAQREYGGEYVRGNASNRPKLKSTEPGAEGWELTIVPLYASNAECFGQFVLTVFRIGMPDGVPQHRKGFDLKKIMAEAGIPRRSLRKGGTNGGN